MRAAGNPALITRFVGALGVVAVAHLLDVGGNSRISLWADLFNAGHVVLMGAFALVMLGISSNALGDRISIRAGHYLVAFLATVAVGSIAEIVQIPGPRHADVSDVVRDAAGALCFLSFYAAWDRSLTTVWTRYGRWMRFSVVVVATAVLVVSWSAVIRWGIAFYERNQVFPKLTSFSSSRLGLFWSTRNATLQRSAAPLDWGRAERNEVGRLICLPSTRSGFAINMVYPDWSRFQYLHLAIYLDLDSATTFIVQIEDKDYVGTANDRLTFVTEAWPGSNSIMVPLNNPDLLYGNRALELTRIEKIYFLTSDTTRTITLYVDDIELR